jgi:hypothetical protein
VKELEAVANDPHALWANWLRGTVKLPAGIGDVRQYQERIQRLVEAGNALLKVVLEEQGLYFPDFIEPIISSWDKAKEGL